MGRDNGRSPVDWGRDEPWLACSDRGDHLRREPAREHERLRLERSVEKPKQPESYLEVAACDAMTAG